MKLLSREIVEEIPGGIIGGMSSEVLGGIHEVIREEISYGIPGEMHREISGEILLGIPGKKGVLINALNEHTLEKISLKKFPEESLVKSLEEFLE